MIALLLTALAVFTILVGSELWWRGHSPHGEFSRKFVHITVGIFVAFWPLFLSWNQIRLLALGFIIGIAVSKWLNVFQSIHSVQRPTWGEVFFALVVGLLTFVTHSKSIYAASLLQMSLADGLAALIGVKHGKRNQYYVFGHAKSVVGSLTFLGVSFALLAFYKYYTDQLPLVFLAVLPLVAAVIENVGIAGLDNLLVPLLVAVVLTFFANMQSSNQRIVPVTIGPTPAVHGTHSP